MKISKKIIIAVVVAAVAAAVAAYLLWKRHRDNEAGNGGSSNMAATDPNSLEYVITASGMTTSEANFARKLKEKVESTELQRLEEEAKAEKRGFTYAQMIALDAIWSLYYDNATADFKEGVSDTTKKHVWKVQNAIKSM